MSGGIIEKAEEEAAEAKGRVIEKIVRIDNISYMQVFTEDGTLLKQERI